MNSVRQIVEDTKARDPRWQTGMAGVDLGLAPEEPEAVMEKIRQQATCLGPVMEESLRATQERGQNRWGINE